MLIYLYVITLREVLSFIKNKRLLFLSLSLLEDYLEFNPQIYLHCFCLSFSSFFSRTFNLCFLSLLLIFLVSYLSPYLFSPNFLTFRSLFYLLSSHLYLSIYLSLSLCMYFVYDSFQILFYLLQIYVSTSSTHKNHSSKSYHLTYPPHLSSSR